MVKISKFENIFLLLCWPAGLRSDLNGQYKRSILAHVNMEDIINHFKSKIKRKKFDKQNINACNAIKGVNLVSNRKRSIKYKIRLLKICVLFIRIYNEISILFTELNVKSSDYLFFISCKKGKESIWIILNKNRRDMIMINFDICDSENIQMRFKLVSSFNKCKHLKSTKMIDFLLNAGWSIHTGKKAVKKDPQLTEAELIEIQKVLQRSEKLEQNERDRVIKLVDRLENMKRNASQAGCNLSPNRCALCGDYFCLLRTAPTQCSSCNMILCNKCCIDTECTIDNDLSSNPSQSRRNSSSNGSMANSLIGSASTNSKTVYLCRICSEQREVEKIQIETLIFIHTFLKKSGAWFLRKFPNYLTDGINTKLKSPISPAKNQEIFQFDLNSYHPYKESEESQKKILNHNSVPPIKNFNTTSDSSVNLFNEANVNCLNGDAISTDTSSENNKSSFVNKSKISTFKISAEYDATNDLDRSYKLKEPNVASDEDCSSPNMANYNYYSKILTSMNMSLVNDNTSVGGQKSMIDSKDDGFSNGTKILKNAFRSKNRSISSITDEVFNNSLSASASNLNLEANLDKNRNMTQVKCATAKLSRKNRNEEWCSTRLSIVHQ
ncbi:rabphilin-3A isoform X1 [Brachionus plicatilis]|uniref:Rabphilin-3A isoform X1 n=1 Tax=Brachionus plicatilis TaxID=10195 RepID=A0A3M7SGD4_BRAPC|nr:rabphilin-3A isoform X1 [Brachionus plicatilis]